MLRVVIRVRDSFARHFLNPGSGKGVSVEIYTDGACIPNPGKGGWAYVILDSDGLPKYVGSGFVAETTSNRMELKAIQEALKHWEKTGERCLTIFTDSQYSIGVCSKGYKIKKNEDIISDIRTTLKIAKTKEAEVEFVKVRGHDGNVGNEFADFYANNMVKNE